MKDIDDIDKSLEIACLIRASEAGFARDYRAGWAFGEAGDRQRLDAFTLGMLDALSHRVDLRLHSLELMTYLHKLVEGGPGPDARESFRQMLELADAPLLARYVAAGRYHIFRAIAGRAPSVGRFALLLSDELSES